MKNNEILEKILVAINENKHAIHAERKDSIAEKMNDIYEECIPTDLYIKTIQNFGELDDMDTLTHLFYESGLEAIREAQINAINNAEAEL
jgi:hypothetical protein